MMQSKKKKRERDITAVYHFKVRSVKQKRKKPKRQQRGEAVATMTKKNKAGDADLGEGGLHFIKWKRKKERKGVD